MRVSLTPRIAVLATCVASVLMLTPAASMAAETTVTFEKESVQAYEQQLSKGQLAAATINKKLRSLRLTLKDGRHVLVHYPAHEEAKYASALEAKGVPVTVLKPAAAAREASAKPKHHKLRYITGGVLVVVILIVGAVLLVDRRRKLAAE